MKLIVQIAVGVLIALLVFTLLGAAAFMAFMHYVLLIPSESRLR